jgi:hypothetical protein
MEINIIDKLLAYIRPMRRARFSSKWTQRYSNPSLSVDINSNDAQVALAKSLKCLFRSRQPVARHASSILSMEAQTY